MGIFCKALGHPLSLPEPPASFVEQVYIAPADDDFPYEEEEE
jgi:hypothetical protein